MTSDQQANVAKILVQARQELTTPVYLDQLLYHAQVAMARYKALRKAGFDHIDAVHLCAQPIEL